MTVQTQPVVETTMSDLVEALHRVAVALEQHTLEHVEGTPLLSPLPAPREVEEVGSVMVHPSNGVPQAQAVVSQPQTQTAPFCPQGHGLMHIVPGGISKRTGKAYDAFWGCSVRDCKETRPA